MFQKKLLRTIYNAESAKKKNQNSKYDVEPTKTPDEEQEQHKQDEQNTNDWSLPTTETETQQLDPNEECTLEGYTGFSTTGEMSEPRARAARQKGQLNFGNECKSPLCYSNFAKQTLQCWPRRA